MRRILEKSPVTGYQLFRFENTRPDGTKVLYPNFYIRHGKKTTNTKTAKLSDAKAKIKKMAGEDAGAKRHVSAVDVRVGALLDLVIEDYVQKGYKTLADARGKINNGLRPFFSDLVASEVDSEDINGWMKWRRGLHLRSSKFEIEARTINCDLQLLRRAFQLGYDRSPPLIGRIPRIKKLGENPPRKGFVTTDQYRALMAQLPGHLRPITCIAFHVANRRGELLNLEWSDVDLDGNPPVLTLWPGETKNKDGRTLPILAGEMTDTLRALKAERDAKWPKQNSVFVNQDGDPLLPSMMRKSWASACKRAGVPGLLFHDLRRSAVRNLRRAGVTQSVARLFSGHKTDSVFNRYNITDFDDLKDAAARLEKYLGGNQVSK